MMSFDDEEAGGVIAAGALAADVLLVATVGEVLEELEKIGARSSSSPSSSSSSREAVGIEIVLPASVVAELVAAGESWVMFNDSAAIAVWSSCESRANPAPSGMTKMPAKIKVRLRADAETLLFDLRLTG